MAWKRGTQNNVPGMIRKGHIKEFVIQASKDDGISATLKTVETEKMQWYDQSQNCATAFICTIDNLPQEFIPFVIDNTIYLHAHEYPRSVITAVLTDLVPSNTLVINQSTRINSKLCTGELQKLSVFRGEKIMYDSREGTMGDNMVRTTNRLPAIAKSVLIEIRPQQRSTHGLDTILLDCKKIESAFVKMLYRCIVSLNDIFVIYVDNVEVVGRALAIYPEIVDDVDDNNKLTTDEDIFQFSDDYQGIIDEFSLAYLRFDPIIDSNQYSFVNQAKMPDKPKHKHVICIKCNDGEVFPVKKRLLRPCIALTNIVQAGKGKYKQLNNNNNSHDRLTNATVATSCNSSKHNIDLNATSALSYNNSIHNNEDSSNNNIIMMTFDDDEQYEVENVAEIDVDACTFDRVLLYLEHEARGEVFHFDPLLVQDLLSASITLGIRGLQDICEKVLGSFQDRVRTIPIRLEEINQRNDLGGKVLTNKNKRSETLLMMSGMVFDITRWLEEHPGGSTIIPEQALGVDCTVFFEIYHASRQSFLYLKEFYIGELALEDRPLVPLPKGYHGNATGKASTAFMDQLHNITKSWRLDINNMKNYETYKSF